MANATTPLSSSVQAYGATSSGLPITQQPAREPTIQELQEQIRVLSVMVLQQNQGNPQPLQGTSPAIQSNPILSLSLPEGEYKGAVKDGVPNGIGELTYNVQSNRKKYKGSFLDGKPHGNGKMEYKNGDLYVGNWENNIPNGLGTYTWANQDRYEGEFKDGNKHGKGAFTWASGNSAGVYVGSFVNDLEEGQGIRTWTSDGRTFTGTYNKGQMKTGTLKYQNGTYYQGQWNNNGGFSGSQHWYNPERGWLEASYLNGKVQTSVIEDVDNVMGCCGICNCDCLK